MEVCCEAEGRDESIASVAGAAANAEESVRVQNEMSPQEISEFLRAAELSNCLNLGNDKSPVQNSSSETEPAPFILWGDMNDMAPISLLMDMFYQRVRMFLKCCRTQNDLTQRPLFWK